MRWQLNFTSANIDRPLDILAIAAHPDDVEQTCGGTLLRMAGMGYRAGVLDLTAGGIGKRGPPGIGGGGARGVGGGGAPPRGGRHVLARGRAAETRAARGEAGRGQRA